MHVLARNRLRLAVTALLSALLLVLFAGVLNTYAPKASAAERYENTVEQTVNTKAELDNSLLGQTVNTMAELDDSLLGQSVKTMTEFAENTVGQPVKTIVELVDNTVGQPVNAMAELDDSTAGRPVNAAAEGDESVEVYRLYNGWDGSHLITKDAAEKNVLTAQGWIDEGVAFKAPAAGKPVYRLYNATNGDHFYTADATEQRALAAAGWTAEGTGFYAATEPTAFPVLRLYNPYMTANCGRGNHIWTTSQDEYDQNVGLGWVGEKLQWYATGAGAPKAHPDPVSQHGALKVRGTNLVDKNGAPFQLRGMSTHGLSFAEEGVPFKEYVNEAAFRTLRDDWGANCVRLAMYTDNYNGYCAGGNQNELKDVIRRGVAAASNLGMYVIVDWHILENGNPTAHENEAREFFATMSREFQNRINVLYEICNEPNGCDWPTVKGYAERIIPVIRANDPDAIVIVGNPEWCQRVDTVAQDRLSGAVAENTMYALHFYANTHTQWLRDRMNAALDAGLPIFISEFGTCDASGNGGLNLGEAAQWLALANSRNVSWMNWSLCLKNETASAIQPWCKKTSGWEPSELTPSGAWVREQMRAAA